MIVNVAREAWHAAHADLLPADEIDRTLDQWYDADDVREQTRGSDPFYVAADANEVVGFAHGGADDEGRATLHRIYARKVFWGTGLGSRLLAAVAADLAEAGHGDLRAAVLAGNEVGRAFYDARGFEEVERRTARFGEASAEEVVVTAPLRTLFEGERESTSTRSA